MCMCVRAQSCLTLTLWAVACQAALSMGFPRQEYRSGLPFPSPGHLPHQGIEPESLVSPALAVDSLPLSHLGSSKYIRICTYTHTYTYIWEREWKGSPLWEKISDNVLVYGIQCIYIYREREKYMSPAHSSQQFPHSWRSWNALCDLVLAYFRCTSQSEEVEIPEVELLDPILILLASGPITSWQIDGEKVETVTDFIFLGSKIIADGDCSHESKRCLLLGRKERKVKSLSRVRRFATPWAVAYHAPLSMGFSRQEYWCRLPFPSPEDLSDPGIKPGSPAL